MDQQATFAAVIALSAACAFAVSNALQHRAASGVPRGVSKVGRVLLHLARNPWWLTGTLLSFIGMLLHASALRWGSLAFVQPLLLVGLVLAIPVRAALERSCPCPESCGRSRSPQSDWRRTCPVSRSLPARRLPAGRSRLR